MKKNIIPITGVLYAWRGGCRVFLIRGPVFLWGSSRL